MRTQTWTLALCCLALLTTGLLPTEAAADESGPTGRVTKLAINAHGSDKYASFHGSVTIGVGSGARTYFWGGTACPAQSLNEGELQLLSDALNNRSRTQLTPRYRGGEAGKNRCLVGFELVAGA